MERVSPTLAKQYVILAKPIEEEITTFVGGAKYINKADLMRYLGVSKDRAKEFASELPAYKIGNMPKYRIKEVAFALVAERAGMPAASF